ncbi:pantoate--beta-alanine ligase [Flavobacteriales bacterium]|nr:pantoate--beta-alanine ligase [Flavobacteriales bacterium]
MRIVKQLQELNEALASETKRSIGFVPTMGFLHDGHRSLINESKKKADFTVVSIFINPTQFNNPTDLENYPVSLKKDLIILEKDEVDLVFYPDFDTLYNNEKPVEITLGTLGSVLEAKKRKGHFHGVIRVVNLFFKLINPNYAFFGEKDYQQYLIINQFTKVAFPQIEIIMCPTYREQSGLAMSSRNSRLSSEDFDKSIEIYRVLTFCKKNFNFSNREDLEKICLKKLSVFSDPEYFEIRHSNDLLNNGGKLQSWRAFAATNLGGIRLIDNIVLD